MMMHELEAPPPRHTMMVPVDQVPSVQHIEAEVLYTIIRTG
jgi:hypothetical protein